MKIIPRTLLGRTALSLGVLMLVSQILWLGSAAYFLIRPLKRSNELQVAVLVTLAQSLIEARFASGETPLANEPFMGQAENFKIVPDSQPRPLFEQKPDGMLTGLVTGLRAKFGPELLVAKQRDQSILWVRFRAHGHLYWAVFPKSEPLIPFYVLLGIGIGVSLSIAGAYFIIFRLTQQLRILTKAAQAVGRGEPPIPTAETGPVEILNLSRGFNQMAKNLGKLDQDRRLMLAGISHDLKTPLTHLRIAVELASTRADPDIADGMIQDIEEMDRILKQFLDYARDGSEESPTCGDFDQVVSGVCDRYRSRATHLVVSLGGVPPLAFRQLAMRRVVTNLVDNAVRYGRAGIQVKTDYTETHAILWVLDDGPGIQSGDPNDYIKAFAREDHSRSESGTGLGLAIVDRILRTHGGGLRLENRPTGGFLARVEIPRDAAHREPIVFSERNVAVSHSSLNPQPP